MGLNEDTWHCGWNFWKQGERSITYRVTLVVCNPYFSKHAIKTNIFSFFYVRPLVFAVYLRSDVSFLVQNHDIHYYNSVRGFEPGSTQWSEVPSSNPRRENITKNYVTFHYKFENTPSQQMCWRYSKYRPEQTLMWCIKGVAVFVRT